MNITTFDWYTPKLCQQYPKVLFVFGDNLGRVGRGGQAVIRTEPNSIGIATKSSISEYMSDSKIYENTRDITADVIKVKEKFFKGGYEVLAFPSAGLGWGLADMQKQCPKTALFLSSILLEQFGFNNLQSLHN